MPTEPAPPSPHVGSLVMGSTSRPRSGAAEPSGGLASRSRNCCTRCPRSARIEQHGELLGAAPGMEGWSPRLVSHRVASPRYSPHHPPEWRSTWGHHLYAMDNALADVDALT